MKANTSRVLREKFLKFHRKVYWGGGGIWSKDYFISTVGIDEKIIRLYVQKQMEEDAGQAQLEL